MFSKVYNKAWNHYIITPTEYSMPKKKLIKNCNCIEALNNHTALACGILCDCPSRLVTRQMIFTIINQRLKFTIHCNHI